MRLYLAGSFSARPQLRELAQRLGAAGHLIVSRWLTVEEPPARGVSAYPAYARHVAQLDLEDLWRADALVLCTEVDSSQGAMYVELGWALARGLTVYLLGPRTNVFIYRSSVVQADTVARLLEVLGGRA